MLDTIRVEGPFRLKMHLSSGRKDAGIIRLWIDEAQLKRFEVSLPRLLFGHHGRCLPDQVETDSALNKCWEQLSQLADMPPPSEWKPSRIDVGANFHLPAQQIIAAHGNLTVPGIRARATIYAGGTGVSWKGAKSRKIVTLYDKGQKMRMQEFRGKVLRAEVRLCGSALRELLERSHWWDFEWQYGVFRRIMTSIPPVIPPQRCSRWTVAAAQLPKEWRDRMMASLSGSRSARKWRNDIEAHAALQDLGQPFSWADILPVAHPPAMAVIEPRIRFR